MARAKQNFLGVFENMDFPEYKFQEYPQVVGYKDEAKRDPIIVNDAKEHVEFITMGSPGAHIPREEELAAELKLRETELAEAKKMLAEFKAQQDAAKAKAVAAPVKGA